MYAFGFAFCVAIIGIVLLWVHKYVRVWQLMERFPGPKAWPLIGNAHLFYGLQPAQAFAEIEAMYRKHGDTIRIWLGTTHSIFMSNPKDVEVVLGTTRLLQKSQEYNFMRPWLNDGLLLSSNSKWVSRRKTLTPAFHFKILEVLVEIFDREFGVLVENLRAERQRNGGVIDLGQWITLMTLDVICESAMGVSIHAQTNADSEYVRAVKTISTVTHKRMFDILYRFDLTYKFTSLAREEKKALAILHGFTEKIIVQRREELLRTQQQQSTVKANGTAKEEEQDIGAKRKMAFLDILLQSEIDGKPLSNMDIREEVDTFMFEGHDTTSSAITFLFYNLARYSECQRKCYDEILSVLGTDKSVPVTYEQLNNLHYVELCIKETLRMFPSVPLLGRKVTEECEINGRTIPAGTNIGISPLHLGHLEDIFPEPEAFKPERFDVVTNAEKINPYVYIPFSAGPRNCIGQRFAMLEIKSVATKVLRHFDVQFVGDAQEQPVLIAELILRTKDPLMFKLQPRVYEKAQ